MREGDAGMDAKAQIRDFLIRRVMKGAALSDDELFWDTRAIDSLGIIELITFLEGAFGLKIPGRDVNSTTFGSVNAVADYIARRRSEGGAPQP